MTCSLTAYTPTGLVVKAALVAAMVLQVVLWPCAASITFTSLYALGELLTLLTTSPRGQLWEALLAPGVLVLRPPGPATAARYAYMALMGAYFAAYFGLFIGHELNLQPAATFWLPPDLVGNYSLHRDRFEPLPVDVTSSASSTMRANQFVWDRHTVAAAPPVVGLVAGAGPAGAPLVCPPPSAPGPNASAFACFAKLWQVATPEGAAYRARPFLPLDDSLYELQVRVSPPAGVPCGSLEVYRVTLDKDRNVVHGLDYPSSTVPTSTPAAPRAPVLPPLCGLFGVPSWCLQIAHTFSDADYRRQMAAKCAENDGRLVLKLPLRAPDIDFDSGRVAPDLLVASGGASVEIHAVMRHAATGDEPSSASWLWAPWHQAVYHDSAAGLRYSTRDGDVFLKFAVAVTPLLVVWYFVATEFLMHVQSDVLFLCIFVLTPATLLFLSVGAWVPMGSCILCAIAVNHSVKPGQDGAYARVVRRTLLFVTAACNSLEFFWLIALISMAGYSAFLYQPTLEQLYSLSDRFIISDASSPTWTALVLPCLLTLTGTLMVGSASCLVVETLADYRGTAAGITSSSSSRA